LPYGKTASTDVVNTKRKDIQVIRVYNDSAQSTYTDYVNIAFYGLWRKLNRKNGNGLYDNFDNMGNAKYSEKRIVLVTGNQRLLMYNQAQQLFHNRYSYLLKFINNRYRTHFKRSDFENEMAEIEYILEKEGKEFADGK
jgi:hypothetical protein